MKRIGIVGIGFVGEAVLEGMRHAFEVVTYDVKDSLIVRHHIKKGQHWQALNVSLLTPKAWVNAFDEIDGPIFVCVPTPMTKEGICDTSIVENVLRELNEVVTNKKIIVIKSTVVPGTTEEFDKKFANLDVCYNPEFLTERNYIEDFKNQDRIIIGGPRPATATVKLMYEISYPDVPVTKTSSTIAEMVKYLTNTFLATKVSFANEIKQVCDALKIDYDKVIEYATKDKRLGNSHWAVPGPDGQVGFGGSCFPKDLNALARRAEALLVNPVMLRATWLKNIEVRPEKDWEKLKGRAVN